MIINRVQEADDAVLLFHAKAQRGAKKDLITHVDIICYYSNKFDSTTLYLHRLRLASNEALSKSLYCVASSQMKDSAGINSGICVIVYTQLAKGFNYQQRWSEGSVLFSRKGYILKR